MVYALKLKSKILAVLLGGLLASFPVITSMFGFMFTAGMYAFGTFMGVAGVLCVGSINKIKGWGKWIVACIGIGLQAGSVGVYQANIGVIVAFTIIVFLKSLDDEEIGDIASALKSILYYVAETLGYLVAYYVAAIYFVNRVGESLSSYQGIGNMEDVGILEYLSRIPLAYSEFFAPTPGQSRYMYSGGVKYYYYIVLVLSICFVLWNLCTRYRHKVHLGIVYALAVSVFPLAVNIIYVMCDENIYSMMMYGEVMIFVLLLYLCSNIRVKWKNLVKTSAVIPLAIVMVLFCRYANVCYLSADYVQKAGIAYFNRMVARIESEEGYVAGMPVVFIGERPEVDSSLFLYPEFNEVQMWPYFKTMINNHSWYLFMKSTCGFNPPLGDPTLFVDKEEVIAMPQYPSEGSIMILDECVIVKLKQ